MYTSIFPFFTSSGGTSHGATVQDDGDGDSGAGWPSVGVGAGVVPMGRPPGALLPSQTSFLG